MSLISSGFNMQRRIRENDISAFEILFREYYSPLCHFAFKFVRDMDSAEEIVQEFFYIYWKNRESIQIKLSVKAYLYRSIRNLSLKHIEQQQVRRRYIEREMGSTAEFHQENQLEQIQLREMQQVIDHTLAGLPERCSLIFKMSRLEGKKYQEIADALGISIKTVEANIGKALQLLRTNLEAFQKDPVKKN